jgi:hypothetical protein
MATKKSKEFEAPKTITSTPSGVQIAYFDGKNSPRRAYFIRQAEAGADAFAWEGVEGWREVPSVTAVLDVLGKDALSWWGMRVGFKALAHLWDEGLMTFEQTTGRLVVTVDAVWQYADFSDGGNVEQLVKLNNLDVNKVKGEAADRGTAAHDALEAWAADTSFRPVLDDYPPEEWQYLVALTKFMEDVGEDAWETTGSEIAVGSAEYGFAGRYDLRGRFLKDVNLINRTLLADGSGVLKKGPRRMIIPAGTRCLLDAKTAKRIYPTHLMQLEAYEGAGVECGYEETDMRAVIHLSPHGEYQFFPAKAKYQDFLDLIPAYHAVERAKKALSE